MQLKTFCPYLVGDVYITTGNHSPSTVWPGTSWQAIEGKFLVGANADYTGGSTGGSATHYHTTGDCTLTTNQIPSHNHSVGAHAHGLNSHTHTYAKPNTPTGSTAITVAQLASHGHPILDTLGFKTIAYGSGDSADGICNRKFANAGYGDRFKTAGSGSAHTHTIGTTSTNSGGPSTTNTANSAAFNSGTAGGGGAHNHGNTGSGSSLPPYLAVYMWKRVA